MKILIRATNSIGELLLIYVVLLIVCAGLFAGFEQRTFGDALWWTAVTATTTGYGDISPSTLGGRIVAMVLMHATLLFILPLLIGRVISVFMEDHHRFTDEEQRQLMTDVAELKAKLGRAEAAPRD
ncbi:ion channel [Brevundimonas sp.]